jgi:hypothetical protein
MRKTVIVNNQGIRVVLFGGGTAVLVEQRHGTQRHNWGPAHLFLQGDDAAQFMADWEDMEQCWPERSQTEIAKHLWNDRLAVTENGFADDELAKVGDVRMYPGH